MMTASLAILPEELLDLIITHLTSSRSTLHSLTLVSHKFNRLATFHLYTHISLTKSDFLYLRPLAVLLWTSPAHRSVVRSFSVRHAYGGNLDPWPKHYPKHQHQEEEGGLDELIKGQIERYVREKDKEEWFGQVRHGVGALPIASLLLRSLPNVREMQFDGFMLVDPAGRGKAGKQRWE